MLGQQHSGNLAEEEGWVIVPVDEQTPPLCLFTSLGALTRVLSVAWYLECGALSVQSPGKGGQVPGHGWVGS